METTRAFEGFLERETGERFDAESAIGGDTPVALRGQYDYDSIAFGDTGRQKGIWAYESLLPIPASAGVTMGEGETPLIDCPTLAEELGVERVLLKDEGANPTGSIADRGQALAVSAAAAVNEKDVAAASTGNGGQSMAAYAARAGLDSHSFVPSRSSFLTKAMINVHGGDMSVIEGRYRDAAAAFADALEEAKWRSLSAFSTPYRHAGTKTLAYELVDELDSPPEHVVFPTGHGLGLVGTADGMADLQGLGELEERPSLYAGQAAGCAPIADAFEAGETDPTPVESPDTICGAIEIADPDGGSMVLDAIAETGGSAVATPDDEILDSALALAQNEGVEVGASPAAAASAAWTLAENGEFESEDTVVLINTSAGAKENDLLRSQLMSKGI